MKKVIFNNLRIMYPRIPDEYIEESVDSTIVANNSVTLEMLNQLHEEGVVGDHPCMDGMWY